MKIYKLILSASVVLIMASSFYSCGDSGISGVFVPKEKSRIKSIEFKDGSVRFTDSFLGIKQGCMEFDVKGDSIKIIDPVIGALLFKIVDEDTLKCEISGMSGLYIRQK